MNTILNTSRLSLRTINLNDADFMLDLLNDQTFIKNINDRNIRNMEQAKVYIQEKILASYTQHKYGMYVVQITETQERIGLCGLVFREQLTHPDIGYAYLQKYQGNGYAKEAASAFINYIKAKKEFQKILAICQPQNLASISVIEAMGFKYEKVFRLVGEDKDLNYYSIQF